MIINGVKIKKYKAKVRNIIPMTTIPEVVNTDEYRIVEGYVSIQSIVLPYGIDGNEKPQYHYVFVSDEVDCSQIAFSGFGKSVFTPIMYDKFEIVGEVEY